ncbi:ATP-binding cassette domain-containing protein [Membranihabitans marinus]|uniref:ATP-binding cassette domain-containing protein n=1 Tax=Membranihabitans marinus TaxID=1227546 RepID=UPI001F025ECF|nr:ATP-binding cassette domain-containing protein [Membranihabitans marinus]
MGIEVHQISKTFGSQKAVHQLSFSANKGEVLGFLGPNGAGKTTSLRMIAGHLMPDEGRITYNDVDINQHPLQAKQWLGYLPENNPLYMTMYVKEILGFYAGLHKLPNPTQRINHVIDRVGLRKESNKLVQQLSKGYKQRVGIAIAILHDPEIVLLDEPISGLDPNQLSDIRQLIRDLAVDKTVIYSSHILSEVEMTCDKVLIINDGQLKAIHSIQEVKKWRQKKQVIYATFDTKSELHSLKDLPHVESCRSLGNGQYRIEVAQGQDVRKALYLWTVDKGVILLESKVEESSMESVFKALTK